MPKTITKIAYPPRLQSKKKVAAYRRWRDIIDCFLTIIRQPHLQVSARNISGHSIS